MNRRSLLHAIGLGWLANIVLAPKHLLAQTFNLTGNQAQPTVTQYQVESLLLTRRTNAAGQQNPLWQIVLTPCDAGGNPARARETFQGEGSAQALALCNQLLTAVSGETGGNVRRLEARQLEFLRANGHLPPGTLAP